MLLHHSKPSCRPSCPVRSRSSVLAASATHQRRAISKTHLTHNNSRFPSLNSARSPSHANRTRCAAFNSSSAAFNSSSTPPSPPSRFRRSIWTVIDVAALLGAVGGALAALLGVVSPTYALVLPLVLPVVSLIAALQREDLTKEVRYNLTAASFLRAMQLGGCYVVQNTRHPCSRAVSCLLRPAQ